MIARVHSSAPCIRDSIRARFETMTIKNLAILLVVLALAGCASTPGGTDSTQAGTSSVINGVEVWKGGVPSRPYRVIATVSREAADGSTSFADQEISIAREASQRGADAVIVQYAVMAVSRIDPNTGRSIMAPKVAAELIQYQ
jgi:hypothetical protein